MTNFGLVGFPPFRRSQKQEIQQIHRGLGNGFRKRSGLYKIDKFWAFVGFHGFRKRSGLYKIDKFCAFVGFPPFRRSQKPEIQETRRGLGNGFRKRSGLYKIDKFCAFVGFPSISAATRKSRKSTGALEMASRKGADSTKSTNFGLLWCSLHFGGPRSRKARKSAGALEMASGKGADSAKSTFRRSQKPEICEIDNLAAFVRFPSFRRPPATGNPENPGCLRTLWGVIYLKRV